MDEIAKRAKIGPGTLYRHFPTRDELLATVYITEVEKLAAVQKTLSAELSRVLVSHPRYLLLQVEASSSSHTDSLNLTSMSYLIMASLSMTAAWPELILETATTMTLTQQSGLSP